MKEIAPYLPHVNATLNAVASVLLLVGYCLIKTRRERAHKWTMLACFDVSILFLISYIVYHVAIEGSKRFPQDTSDGVRTFYYFVLLTHVIFAAAVPFLAVATIYLGLSNRRSAHVRLARWTFPIWLYVSITGVIVYVMLYHIYAR